MKTDRRDIVETRLIRKQRCGRSRGAPSRIQPVTGGASRALWSSLAAWTPRAIARKTGDGALSRPVMVALGTARRISSTSSALAARAPRSHWPGPARRLAHRRPWHPRSEILGTQDAQHPQQGPQDRRPRRLNSRKQITGNQDPGLPGKSLLTLPIYLMS